MTKKAASPRRKGKRAGSARAAERPRRLAELEVGRMDDGFIVHQSGRDRVHYFNHTGLLVFELCDGRHTAAEIAELIRRAYKLPRPPIAEIRQILARMTDEGLVTCCSPPP